MTQVYGYDFDIDHYIRKDQYNIAFKEKAEAREIAEQAKKKEAQAKKKEEDAKIEKEQDQKREQQLLKIAVIAFNKNNFKVEQIAETLKIDLQKVKDILVQKDSPDD